MGHRQSAREADPEIRGGMAIDQLGQSLEEVIAFGCRQTRRRGGPLVRTPPGLVEAA